MRQHVLAACLGAAVVVLFSGCVEHQPGSGTGVQGTGAVQREPARFIGANDLSDLGPTITYCCDRALSPEGAPKFDITTTSSSDDPDRERTRTKFICGTVDGERAKGCTMEKCRRGEAPFFRILAAATDQGERRVAVFEGYSDVSWQLVVEGAADVSIEMDDHTIQKPAPVLSEGTFRVVVDVPKPDEEPDFTELLESKRRSGTMATMNSTTPKAPGGMPVELTCQFGYTPKPEIAPFTIIGGALMQTSPGTQRKPATVEGISGTIDGDLAIGHSVHEENWRKPPLFHVLAANSGEDGDRMAVFEGYSDVPWQLDIQEVTDASTDRGARTFQQLDIQDATDVSIRMGEGTIEESEVVFSEGAFRVEVCVAGGEVQKKGENR